MQPACKWLVSIPTLDWVQSKTACCRYRTDRKHLSIDLSHAGMPLTIAHWQDGSLDVFPEAICTPTWWTELPAKAPVPVFIDDMDVNTLFLDCHES